MAALAKLEAQQLAAALAQSLVTLDEAETTNGTSGTTSTNLHNQVHNTKNIKQNSAETVNTGKEKETSQQHSHSDSNNDDSDNSNSDEANSNSDNSDSDNDSEYSGYVSSDNSDDESEKVSPLLKEQQELHRMYGSLSCFCLPLETRKLYYKDYMLVYLSFPTKQVLQGKLNLSGAWGFDPESPIVMRFRAHKYDWDNFILARGFTDTLDVEFYQGSEEPPLFKSNVASTHSSNVETKTDRNLTKNMTYMEHPVYGKYFIMKEIGHLPDSVIKNQMVAAKLDSKILDLEPTAKVQSLCSASTKTTINAPPKFRLREQLKRIAETYLVSNWKNKQGQRKHPVLTYQRNDEAANGNTMVSSNKVTTLRQSSGHHCPFCTYLNLITDDSCEICGNNLHETTEQETKSQRTLRLKTPTPPKTRDQLLTTFVEEVTRVTSPSDSLLLHLYTYITKRLSQLHRFCVNCDHPHVNFLASKGSSAGTLLRPSVCRRDLCSWAFTELGVGKASTDELASTAEVVDLLLALTSVAACSTRASVILTPFPTVIDATTREKILDPNKPNHAYVYIQLQWLRLYSMFVLVFV